MSSERLDILLVEDDPAHAELVIRGFSPAQNRFNLSVAENIAGARDYLATHNAPALIISDWRLTDGDGMELLTGGHSTPVVLMTSQGNERIAVEAMKAGALDYVVKSEVSLAEMPHTADRALRVWHANLQRRRAEDELRRRVRHLTALSAIAGLAIECDDEHTMLHRAAQMLAADIFSEHISILLIDETAHILRPAASFYLGQQDSNLQDLDLGRGISGRTIRTGVPQRVGDTKHDQDYIAVGPIMRSELCVPLRVNQKIIGVINCEFSSPDAFSADDEQLLVTIANEIATAIGRLRGAQALKESEERFRRLAESSFEGLAIVRDDGRIVDANDALVRLTGYGLGDLANASVPDLLVPEARAKLRETIRSERTTPIEVVGLRQNGSTLPLEIEARTAVRDGQRLRILAVRDLTERKAIEAKLQQNQKLQVLGQLASAIAHDFNNLLTVILGYSDLVLSELAQIPGFEALQPLVQQIRDAGKRAAALTQQLLAFSRRQTLELKIVDLNEVVRNLLRMLQRLIGEEITLVTDLAPGLERVRVDHNQMEQVIMNLSMNARDAMKEGGTLTIRTRNVVVESDNPLVEQGLSAGPHVLMEVEDTGTGMPPEVLKQIFEPFFTTKEPGKGTGLGLATVHGIVKQSGGNITVKSAPGQGTTFRIYLAAAREALPAPEDAEELLSEPSAGSETILLVEDEPTVRRLAFDVLRKQGYNVLEASEQEAIELGRDYAGPIHLLLADVVMPTMNGRDLADQLVRLRPSLKVLYVSGYADDVVAQHGISLPNAEFLQKPYDRGPLLDKVRRVLRAEAKPS